MAQICEYEQLNEFHFDENDPWLTWNLFLEDANGVDLFERRAYRSVPDVTCRILNSPSRLTLSNIRYWHAKPATIEQT